MKECRLERPDNGTKDSLPTANRTKMAPCPNTVKGYDIYRQINP